MSLFIRDNKRDAETPAPKDKRPTTVNRPFETEDPIEAFRDKAVVLPHHVYWRLAITITVVLTVLLVVYHVLFAKGDTFTQRYLLDMFYAVDWFLHLLLTFHPKKRLLVFRERSIQAMFVDFLSLLPLEKLTQDYRFELNRLLRIYRPLVYFHTGRRNVQRHPVFMVFLECVILMFMICSLGGALLSLTSCDVYNSPRCQKYDMYALEYISFTQTQDRPWQRYIFTQLVMMNEMTQRGFMMDEQRKTMPNKVASFIMILIHLLVFVGLVFPSTVSAIAQRRHTRFTLAENYPFHKALLQLRNCSHMMKTIMEYYRVQWQGQRGILEEIEDMEPLPPAMQDEIRMDAHWNALRHSNLFSGTDNSARKKLACAMHSWHLPPGYYVFTQGQVNKRFIYIVLGTVKVVYNEEILIAYLGAGSVLGGTSLFHTVPSLFTVICVTYCIFDYLEQDAFQKLADEYPTIRVQVEWDFHQRIKLAKDTISTIERMNELFPKEMEERKLPSAWMKEKYNLLTGEGKEKPKPPEERPIWEVAYSLRYLEEYAFGHPTVTWTLPDCFRNCQNIFHPNSLFLETWSKLSGALIIVSAIMVPYYSVTVPRLRWDFIIFFLLVMGLNILDFGLLMVTVVRTPHGLVLHPKKICRLHVRNWLFWVDVTTVLSLFFLFIDKTIHDPFVAFCALMNVIRLHHIYRRSISSRIESLSYINGWALVMFFLWLIFPVYFWSILFYGDTCTPNECGVRGWVKSITTGVNPLLVAFQHMSSMATCTPHLELHIMDNSDIVFSCAAKVSFYIVFVFVTSFITSFIEIERMSRVEYNTYRYHMIRVMNHRKVNQDIQDRVLYCLNTIGTVCDYRLKVYTGKVKYYLPQYVDLYKTNHNIIKFLEVIPLFRNVRADFISALAEKVKIHVLPPYALLVEEGKYSSHLFILEDGICENLVEPGTPKVFHRSMNVFPLPELLGWYPALRTIKTLTNCRIYTIDFFTFKRLLAKYKDIEQHFDRATREVLDEATLKLIEKYRQHKSGAHSVLREELPEVQKSFHEQLVIRRKTSLWLHYLKYFLLFNRILPHGKFVIYWEISRIIFAMLTCFLFPLRRILFIYYSDWIMILFIFFDVTAYLDIYLRFRHAYHDRDGWVVVNRGRCCLHYLTHGFFIDLFACFPFDFFFQFYMNRAPESLLGCILYNNRVVQVYRIRQIELILNHFNIEINHIWWIAVTTIVGLIGVHAIASFHMLLTCTFEKDFMSCSSRTGIAPDFRGLKHQSLQKYLWTFIYFFTYTWGTAYYDEKREIGLIAMSVLTLIGYCIRVVIYSFAIALYVEHNMGFLAYKQSLKQLLRFMNQGKVTQRLTNAVINYNEMYWLRTKNIDSAGLFNIIHPNICSKVLMEMFQEPLKQCRVLAEMGDDAVRLVIPVARLVIFSRRCRLCRINDIMDCVFVVVNGSVLVEGPDRNPLGVFGNGIMFGNLDSGSCNRVNITVIAVDHQVEVLSFRTERLFERLRRFPMFEEVMKHHLRLRVDFVAPVERRLKVASSASVFGFDYETEHATDILRPEGEDDRDVGFLQRARNDAGLENLRNCANWMKWACGFTVLHPYETFVIIIWTMLLISAFISYILVLFQMGASIPLVGIVVFIYLLDAVHGCAIFFTLRCGYFDMHGQLVMDKKSIKERYIKSLVFYTDVISVVPADIIPMSMGYHMVASFTRLNRVLRLVKVCHHLKVHSCSLESIIWLRRIGYIVLFAIRYVLGLAAVLAFLRKIHEPHTEETAGSRTVDFFNATHATLMMLSSGAFNEVKVNNIDFMVFYLVAAVMTHTVWLLMLVWCCSYIHAIRRPLENYVRRYFILENYVKTHCSSKPIYKAAAEYLRLLWFEWKGLNEPELLATIPHIMQQALRSSNYGLTVRSYGFYRNLHMDFMRQILEGVRRCHYYQGYDITIQGIADGCTYFIFSGEVEEVAEGQDFDEDVERILGPGDVFGIVQGVFPDWPHRRTYRARTKVCILYLHHNSWQRLLSFFPAARDEMFNSANSMYIFSVNK